MKYTKEQLCIARNEIKDVIREMGHKIYQYARKDIDKAAIELMREHSLWFYITSVNSVTADACALHK